MDITSRIMADESRHVAFGVISLEEIYQQLDLLRFENLKDSVEEPEVQPPAELVQHLLQVLASQTATAAG